MPQPKEGWGIVRGQGSWDEKNRFLCPFLILQSPGGIAPDHVQEMLIRGE